MAKRLELTEENIGERASEFFGIETTVEDKGMTNETHTRPTAVAPVENTRETISVTVPDVYVTEDEEEKPYDFCGRENATMIMDSPSDLWHLGTIHLSFFVENADEAVAVVTDVNKIWDTLRDEFGAKPMNTVAVAAPNRGGRGTATDGMIRFATDLLKKAGENPDVSGKSFDEVKDIIDRLKGKVGNAPRTARPSGGNRSGGAPRIANPDAPLSEKQAGLLISLTDKDASAWDYIPGDSIEALTKGQASDAITAIYNRPR